MSSPKAQSKFEKDLPITCENCFKLEALCFCEELKAIPTNLKVVILQHPQEPDKELGTARLAHLALPNSVLKIGLSWRNLSAAISTAKKGEEVSAVQNSKWAVLYLGSGAKTQSKLAPGLTLTDKNGIPLRDDDAEKAKGELEGIIILDGTWSQAKTLWWRNAWLLKLRRAILNPVHKSLYGRLRKEPRKECLSTIESVAETLVALGEPEKVGDDLRKVFVKLLSKFETKQKSSRKPDVKTQTHSE